MRELEIGEIKSAVSAFSAGWLKIREGESARFRVKSRTIYDVPSGEEGLDGSAMEFDRWQCKVEDKDGVEKILTVQQRLAKSMLNKLEDLGHDWKEHFQNSEWYVERIDKYNWKVELLEIGSSDDSKGAAKGVKAVKKTPEIPTKKTNAKLTKEAQIAKDMIENNELHKKEMNLQSLTTVISSLTELSPKDAADAIEELANVKLIKIDDDKISFVGF